MPQMSPMLWFCLAILFILIFLFFNLLNYFNFIPSCPTNKIDTPDENSLPMNFLSWKW